MDTALWSSVSEILSGRLAGTRESLAGLAGGMTGSRGLDYGAYTDLILDHPADGELSEVIKSDAESYLMRRLARARDKTGAHASPADITGVPTFSTISRTYYQPEEIERFRRWWDIEPANALCLLEVSGDLFDRACKDLSHAFVRLRQCSDELYRETLEIIHDIVVAKPDSSERLALGGVSSFALWGAFAINPETHDEDGWVHYLKTTVHEAGHNLLFAFAHDQPLVANHPDETYSSPLRSDPRPMDGIFHAAFVSARESLALDALLDWHEETHGLSEAEADLVQSMFEDSVIGFWQCVETLRSDARLTSLGQKIMGECEDFMTERFSLVTT